MSNYYFDIETRGTDPFQAKIITIQFQELDHSNSPVGQLSILKEWEIGEEIILRDFYSRWDQSNRWLLVPKATIYRLTESSF